MNKVLEELRTISPEVIAAAVVGPDGELFAATSDTDLEGVMGPTTTAMTTIAARTVQEMGRGGLRGSILEAAFGRVVSWELGDGRTLVVIAEPSARLGLLLDDVRACSASLSGEVAHA